MKSFFGKVMDFLYDSIDYIIILVVIVGVILVIKWRLGGLFAEDRFATPPEDKNPILDEEVDEDTNEDKIEDIDDSESQDNNEDSEIIVNVEIPSGSALHDIAKTLADKDLIEEEDKFINKTIELNYDTKLRYGEYKIPNNSSIKEILDLLTK